MSKLPTNIEIRYTLEGRKFSRISKSDKRWTQEKTTGLLKLPSQSTVSEAKQLVSNWDSYPEIKNYSTKDTAMKRLKELKEKKVREETIKEIPIPKDYKHEDCTELIKNMSSMSPHPSHLNISTGMAAMLLF